MLFFFGKTMELRHQNLIPTDCSSAEVSEKDAVMYVGIDVTHPTNNSGIDISIASMVANVDLAATRYADHECTHLNVQIRGRSCRYTSEILAQMKARETVERFETQFSRMMLKFHEVGCVRDSSQISVVPYCETTKGADKGLNDVN